MDDKPVLCVCHQLCGHQVHPRIYAHIVHVTVASRRPAVVWHRPCWLDHMVAASATYL